jgi:hypothetical protein
MRIGVPMKSVADADRVAGDPGLGAGQQPVLAQDLVDQRRFAGIRAADDRDLQGLRGRGAASSRERNPRIRHPRADRHRPGSCWHSAPSNSRPGLQGAVKIVHPLAMLGRDAQRLAQTQRIGLQRAGLAGAALGLVGGQDDMLGPLAQDVGEIFIRRRHADAGVDDEQADIGLVHRAFGQAAHPALQAVIGRPFPDRPNRPR